MFVFGHILRDKVDLKNFAYDHRAGLKEELVKEATAAYLRKEGFRVFAGKKHERGSDIRAS